MELTADDAAQMSRGEALRALATGDGVSAADKRMAEIMLAGPDITQADYQRLQDFRPKHRPMAVSVHFAALQMQAEAQDERARAKDDMLELAR